MARFRLTEKHYLNCPGTEWEQIETTHTGKQARHRYKVHRFLDPDDPSTFDPNPEGLVVTTKADPRFPNDILFVGSPTQGMLPLDAEAETLVRGMTFGVAPMSEEAFPAQSAPAPAASKEIAELRAMFAELNGMVTLLQGENTELKRRLESRDEEDHPPVEAAALPIPPVAASIRLGG